MALGTPTNLTNGGSAVSASSFTTALITPTNGNLILLAVASRQAGAGVKHELPRISGAGLTFNLIYSPNQGTVITTANSWKLSLWYAVADASATTGALTFAFSSAKASCGWAVDTVSGQDSGINWCVQAVTNILTGTVFSATLGTLQDTSSISYAAIGANGTNTAQLIVNSGFTSLSKQASGTFEVATEFKVNDPAAGWTNTVLIDGALCAVEITATNTFQRNNPLQTHLLGSSGAGQ